MTTFYAARASILFLHAIMCGLAVCGRRKESLWKDGTALSVSVNDVGAIDNQKVLLSNYHICQSMARGRVGGRRYCVELIVSSLCHGRATAKLVCFVC